MPISPTEPMLKLSLFFLPFQSELTIPDQIHFFESPKLSLSFFNCSFSPMNVKMEQKGQSQVSKFYQLSNITSSPIVDIYVFFTCLQILCIAKHYNIQRIQNQIHTTFTHLSFLAYKTQKWSKIHQDNSTPISFYVLHGINGNTVHSNVTHVGDVKYLNAQFTSSNYIVYHNSNYSN